MQAFEKLGAFYLGRPYDLATKRRGEGWLLYDSRDLVTHAVCVGMTGSGKTGLCVCLLEEAAIDGVPAIVIDPKGDLSNLLLTFPQLRPEDFRPWVNPDDAHRKGLDVDAFAAQQAALWRDGLAEWGQDGERIARLRAAADFAIYTPGSEAGRPVSILHSLEPPAGGPDTDPELARERIATTVTSLLGLLGLDADPIRSREHILLSTIVDASWKAGRGLDLGGLIQQIQAPPVARVGVLDLESFFPAKDRFELAMALNNLLASPGFGAWMTGEPLDVQRLLYTAEGRPRVAIFSIAHLGDAERMFFVSLLLNEVVGWMRAQGGTTSLRALLYMDEIFGYFPPVSNPPSKPPLLTLLKQGRAFGLGVVLATQNPVDLDYKGLSNAGTWFLGRLQTERDKARVIEGLEGAAASAGQSFDRGRMEQTLAALGSRVFLMNNVHEDAPVVFETRWAMSYLRGPLGRQEIKKLAQMQNVEFKMQNAGSAPAVGRAAQAASPAPAPSAPAPSAPRVSPRPVLPPSVPEFFVPVRGAVPAGKRLAYEPALFGAAQVRFADPRAGVDLLQTVNVLTPIVDTAVPVDWNLATDSAIRPGRPGSTARRRRGVWIVGARRAQAEELRHLAEVVCLVGGEQPEADRPPVRDAADGVLARRDGGRIPRQAAAGGARAARRVRRGPARAVRPAVRPAAGQAAAVAGRPAARGEPGEHAEGADRHLVRGHAAGGDVGAQDGERVDAWPRHDRGSRGQPDDEGVGGREARGGDRRGPAAADRRARGGAGGAGRGNRGLDDRRPAAVADHRPEEGGDCGAARRSGLGALLDLERQFTAKR